MPEIVKDFRGYFNVPLYIANNKKPEVFCYLIMGYHTAPMAKCIEYVSKYSIDWVLNYQTLLDSCNKKVNGSLFVNLEDFKEKNRADLNQLQDYVDNYKNNDFYKELERNGLVDFEIPSNKKL